MCVIQVIIEMKIPLVIKQNVFSSKNNALLRFLNALDARVHEREKLSTCNVRDLGLTPGLFGRGCLL